jgi:uncharacterized cupin superfamily protein
MSGVELPRRSVDELAFEPYVVGGRVAGEVHWLRTTDAHIRAGIWRVDPSHTVEPVVFVGHETFQVFEGCADVVVDDHLALSVRPGDVGSIEDGVVAHWWVSAPFMKFFVLGGGRDR